MKTSIETLVRAWVKDNRSYIEDNFEYVEDYLIDATEHVDNWEYEFFTDDEIESKSAVEMREEVKEFATRYRCTPADMLD